MRAKISPIVTAFCAAIIASATPASAQDRAPGPDGKDEPRDRAANAKARHEQGQRHFDAGRYREAAREFRSAHELDPQPQVLFAWAQAERLAGDCGQALELYRRLLQTKQSRANEAAIRKVMGLCEAKPAQSDSDGDDRETSGRADADVIGDDWQPTDDTVEGEVGTSLETTSSTRSSPWYSDPVGDALLAGGVVGLGLGAGYWLAARSALSAAEGSATHDAALDHYDRAKSRQTVARVTAAIGAALLGGALLRYAMRSADEQATAIGAGVESSGASLWLSGRF